jgi:hypothetical protein
MSKQLVRVSILLLVLFAAAIPSLAQGKPKAVVVEAVHDFGDLGRGDRVSKTFVIENQGDADLVIDRVISSCVCLATEYEERIPPGGKGEIEVELDTLTVQGPSMSSIEVGTNDPDNPTLQLTVKAKVDHVVHVNPGYFQYRVVQGFRERGAVGQLLWSSDGTPFTITRIESPTPYLTVTHREATATERQRAGELADADGPFYWVEAVLSPDAPVGPQSGFLKIFVDHPKQSLVPLPVSIFMRPVFAVTPHEVDFGELDIEDEARFQDFKVSNFATETIEITRWESDVEGVEVDLLKVEEGRSWRLTVTFPPSMPKGPFEGEVRLHTESDRAPLITVPVTGTVL